MSMLFVVDILNVIIPTGAAIFALITLTWCRAGKTISCHTASR